MPYNEDQARAVKSLRNRVELIHGPPGTGKSTTIFHVLSARMPAGAASVVTCVTNQAINAVAEKLSITHECSLGAGQSQSGGPNGRKVYARQPLQARCIGCSSVSSIAFLLFLVFERPL